MQALDCLKRNLSPPRWRWILPGVTAALLILACGSRAVEITAAEYWTDNDPGAGNGTALTVTPSTNPAINADLLPALAMGFHTLGLRFQDERGIWGRSLVRAFLVLPAGTTDTPDITDAEYWIDSDPGAGNAQSVDITAGSEPTLAIDLPLQTLTAGLHTVGLRFRDERGLWSRAKIHAFAILVPPSAEDITAAEYWIDTDPGAGFGTNLPLLAGPQPTVAIELPLEALAAGFHRAGMRFRASDGQWSGSQIWGFRVVNATGGTAPALAAAEYFVNYEPEAGNGLPFPLPADGSWGGLLENVQADLTEIPAGRYWIGARFQDDQGTWSLVTADTLLIIPIVTIAPGDPPVLHWIADGSSMFYIYRSAACDGPYTLIDSTAELSYTDLEDPPGSGIKRYYCIAQRLDGTFSSYRYPPEPVAVQKTPDRAPHVRSER